MMKVDRTKAVPVIHMVHLIETVVKKRRLDANFHRDEVEKIFSFILQGQDTVNPYERRDAGVEDKIWDEAILACREFLKLEQKKSDTGNIFDF